MRLWKNAAATILTGLIIARLGGIPQRNEAGAHRAGHDCRSAGLGHQCLGTVCLVDRN